MKYRYHSTTSAPFTESIPVNDLAFCDRLCYSILPEDKGAFAGYSMVIFPDTWKKNNESIAMTAYTA